MSKVEDAQKELNVAQDGLNVAKKQNSNILGKYETILYGRDMQKGEELDR